MRGWYYEGGCRDGGLPLLLIGRRRAISWRLGLIVWFCRGSGTCTRPLGVRRGGGVRGGRGRVYCVRCCVVRERVKKGSVSGCIL